MVRDTFTASKLFVPITGNGLTSASTVYTRKGAVNGALTVSIGAGASGIFEDTTHSDSLVAGNLYNYRVVTGAGAGQLLFFSIIAVALAHATLREQILVTNNPYDSSIGFGETKYWSLNGGTTPNASDAYAQLTARFSGTLSKLRIYLKTNTINGASTFRTRKNAGNGTQSVSVTASTTGAFEDTSNSDSFVSGDTLNTQFVAGGSSGSAIQTNQQVMVASGHFHFAGGLMSVSGAGTRYYVFAGSLDIASTESIAQITSRISTTRRNLFANVTANTRNGASAVTTRKNTANGNLTLSIPSTTTGVFEDIVHLDAIVSGDVLDTAVVTAGTTGSTSFSVICTTWDGVVIVAPTVTTQAASDLGLD